LTLVALVVVGISGQSCEPLEFKSHHAKYFLPITGDSSGTCYTQASQPKWGRSTAGIDREIGSSFGDPMDRTSRAILTEEQYDEVPQRHLFLFFNAC